MMYSATRSGVKVTSEIETLKTNEFHRRRKLRLQQVREQSKDIAKQIRQRAEVEKLRHIVCLDSKKEKEYLEKQEKIVKELEDLYSKSVENVGASHKSASDLNKEKEQAQPAPNISKVRAKEAAALLRQRKQCKLDEKKKLLDRKLQAREVANELFRDKSKAVTTQIQTKLANAKKREEDNANAEKVPKSSEKPVNDEELTQEPVKDKVDMGTQWNFDELPKEWEPAVPQLTLNDKDSRVSQDLSEKSKHLDLFALSEEMPSSLRGGPKTNHVTQPPPTKPSLTLVSEYLQHRSLRLREPEPAKKPEDLQSIKQTIQRTRAVRTEGNDVCSVHDEEVIPVPSWQPCKCGNCFHGCDNHSPGPLPANLPYKIDRPIPPGHYCSKSCLNHLPINSQPNAFNRLRSPARFDVGVNRPTVRGISTSPSCRAMSPRKVPTKQTADKCTRTSDLSLNKKPSVTVYDHATRDTRDIYNKEQASIIRDSPEEDAYSQAMKKNSETVLDKAHERKLQEMRGKVAMTKQSVEKEYNDTISFLNSLPKDKPRTTKQAFMDESRQQRMHDARQRKMQQEYQNIERESRRRSPFAKSRSPAAEPNHEFQYSWLPVPDSDASLAVHTIPSRPPQPQQHSQHPQRSHSPQPPHRSQPPQPPHPTPRSPPQRQERQVQFSRTDSYHEYRSRHKHTPPTKEKPDEPRTPVSSYVETVVADISDSSSDSETTLLPKTKSGHEDMSDAERIIIYKIVESKKKKRSKVTTVRSEGDRKVQEGINSAERLEEGIYAVNEKGDHLPSIQVPETKPNKSKTDQACACARSTTGPAQWECGDAAPQKATIQTATCNCQNTVAQSRPAAHSCSASASSSSFHTAPPTAPSHSNHAPPTAPPHPHPAPTAPDPNGNFYIGASGFLKDEDYEVIIQLRKKDLKDKPVKELDVKGHTSTIDSQTSKSKESVDIEELGDQIVPPVPTQTEPEEKNVAEKRPPEVFTELHQPSVSAFTQTMSSPVTRSVKLHMSSSTSTAYMSPPDALVPKLLEDEVKKYRNKRHECKCKKCKHGSSATSSKDEMTETRRSPRIEQKKAKETKLKRASSPVKSKPCKCRKCLAKSNNSTNTKANQKAFLQLVNRTRSEKKNVNELNPALRGYINRLLALNKEGLKAIEFSNQECSSVTTPGSSIVDVGHNLRARRPHDFKISLEQIKHMIKKQISEDRKHEETNKTIDRNFNKRMQRVGKKNKAIHKVKSLNISKNIHKISKSKSTSSKDERSEVKVQKTEPQSGNSGSKSSTTQRSAAPGSGDSVSSKKSHEKLHAYTHRPRRNEKPNKIPADKNAATLESILTYLTSRNQIPKPKPQPKETIDDDIKLMKIAKSKYRNIGRIADMTKECKQRISDLAEKLEEVRKSKNSGFTNICYSSSSGSQRSDKSLSDLRSDPGTHNKVSISSTTSDNSLVLPITTETSGEKEFVPFLEGIRKPEMSVATSADESKVNGDNSNSSSDLIIKLRHKPPPALSRINLKHAQDNLVPHELSTVVEVDSPLSLKLRSQTTSNEKSVAAETTKSDPKELLETPRKKPSTADKKKTSPEVLKSDNKQNRPKSSTKVQMMDPKQFNEIMLKPFISVEDYAKQWNVGNIEDGSQVEDTLKVGAGNEEMSSLHSDGSLPDVVAELIKRRVIDEPFKFDTPSANSTTASSEVSLSVFASKLLKEQDKANTQFQNKENIAESSDTLSFSSNPDLENAFKQLGMGWASSTLKKTKERLALSSSSNTSSGSQKHKSKFPDKLDPSALSGSILKLMMGSPRRQRRSDAARDVELQTSLKSMTVKEFLTKELANRITFSNKSAHESEEFISLCETKMPDELKNITTREGGSLDESNTNRARTSTPVQLYKSATYQSSSSSNNMSNGLFSNVDELSSVKVTSSSMRNQSSDKDELTVPDCSLRRRDHSSLSKSESQ